jgi:hypothetical protein
MATFKQGIHGKFSGKVGNVIGSSWKGTGVMRIRPASVSNPNTERQQQQRGRFGLVVRFVQAHTPLVKSGFKPWANGLTPYNAAVSYNLANAITGEHPNLSIAFDKVLISRGDLPPVANLAASSPTPGAIHLEWTGSTQLTGARPDDKLMVSVYNEMDNVSLAYASVAERSTGSADLEVPTEWAGKTVQVLVFLIAANAIGAVETKNQVSNTVWAGAVELA